MLRIQIFLRINTFSLVFHLITPRDIVKTLQNKSNSTQKDNMFYLKRITQFYSSENYTIKYLAFKRICLISMTTTMYHLNCQSDQLDFPRQVFICLVKFFLYAYDAWQVEHLYSFWLSVSGWHVFVCLVNPDLVEKVLLQPRHKLVSFLLTAETSAVASFLLLSRLPCAFFVWMLSPLVVFAVKLQSLQVFWSNCSGICCRFVGALVGVRPLDGVGGKDISMLFNRAARFLGGFTSHHFLGSLGHVWVVLKRIWPRVVVFRIGEGVL